MGWHRRHGQHRQGRHRAQVRPRYGRVAVLGTAVAVTALSVLASTGVASLGRDDAVRAAADVRAAVPPGADATPPATPAAPSASPSGTPPAAPVVPADAAAPAVEPSAVSPRVTAPDRADEALPEDSGTGRRAVFSESRQRVWIVGSDGRVTRTYLVSGSTLDNLEPGTYEVYSRSRWAVGIDDSGVMEHFVRFTRGPSGAAIGFHSIPTKDGEPLQTLRQLGTPQSHGCIRQKKPDAIAMWEFADIGTTVVVTP